MSSPLGYRLEFGFGSVSGKPVYHPLCVQWEQVSGAGEVAVDVASRKCTNRLRPAVGFSVVLGQIGTTKRPIAYFSGYRVGDV